jgi:hypothetical protein
MGPTRASLQCGCGICGNHSGRAGVDTGAEHMYPNKAPHQIPFMKNGGDVLVKSWAQFCKRPVLVTNNCKIATNRTRGHPYALLSRPGGPVTVTVT